MKLGDKYYNEVLGIKTVTRVNQKSFTLDRFYNVKLDTLMSDNHWEWEKATEEHFTKIRLKEIDKHLEHAHDILTETDVIVELRKVTNKLIKELEKMREES